MLTSIIATIRQGSVIVKYRLHTLQGDDSNIYDVSLDTLYRVCTRNREAGKFTNGVYNFDTKDIDITCGSKNTLPIIDTNGVLKSKVGLYVLYNVLQDGKIKGYGVVDTYGMYTPISKQKLIELTSIYKNVNYEVFSTKSGDLSIRAKNGTFPNVVMEKINHKSAINSKLNTINKVEQPKVEVKEKGKSDAEIFSELIPSGSDTALPGVKVYSLGDIASDSFNKTAQEKRMLVNSNLSKVSPYYSVMLSTVKQIPTKAIPTMSVTENTMYYNPEFVASLTVEELTYVHIHEMMHIAMQHSIRHMDRDNILWNVATDLYINEVINTDYNVRYGAEPTKVNGGYLKAPLNGIYLSTINETLDLGTDTPEKIYNRLVEENKKKKEEEDKKKQDSNSSQADDSEDKDESEDNSSQSEKEDSSEDSTDTSDSGTPNKQNSDDTEDADSDKIEDDEFDFGDDSDSTDEDTDFDSDSQSGSDGESADSDDTDGDSNSDGEGDSSSESHSGDEGSDSKSNDGSSSDSGTSKKSSRASNEGSESESDSGDFDSDSDESSDSDSDGSESNGRQKNRSGSKGSNSDVNSVSDGYDDEYGQDGESSGNGTSGSQSGQGSPDNGLDGDYSDSTTPSGINKSTGVNKPSKNSSSNEDNLSGEDISSELDSDNSSNPFENSPDVSEVDSTGDSRLPQDVEISSNEEYARQEVPIDVLYNGKNLRGKIIMDVLTNHPDKTGSPEKAKECLDESQTALKRILIKREMEEKEGKSISLSSGNTICERYINFGLSLSYNWEAILRNKANIDHKKTYTLGSPNEAYLNMGMTLASRRKVGKKAKLGGLKFFVDVSGSVGQKELNAILTKIQIILNKFDVEGELVYWDTSVTNAGNFSEIKDALRVKPLGGGGTDINCVFDYLLGKTRCNGKYETTKVRDMSAVMIFTDGYYGRLRDKETLARYFGNKTIWVVNDGCAPFIPDFGILAPTKYTN